MGDNIRQFTNESLTKLKTLSIFNVTYSPTHITDKGFLLLGKLQDLQTVFMRVTQINQETVKALQKMLPNTNFQFDIYEN